jgi:hypothetical protein
MPRKLLRLIALAALSTTAFAGAASAGCPVTGEAMDMMTAGGETPCLAATPAAAIAPAGGATSSPAPRNVSPALTAHPVGGGSFSSSSSSAIAPAGGAATPSGLAGCIAENGDGVTCAVGAGLKSAARTPAAGIAPAGGAATPRGAVGAASVLADQQYMD